MAAALAAAVLATLAARQSREARAQETAAPPKSVAAATDYRRITPLMSASEQQRRTAARALLAAADRALVAGLVDALFFTARPHRQELLQVLRAYTGEDAGAEYHPWVELLGRRADLPAGAGYLDWKRALLMRIDPRYGELLFPAAALRIRLEEVVWGGVRVDGIPALEQPPHVIAEEAGLLGGERVFGVMLEGDSRAYPLRYLSWHEMVNDSLGEQPIVVSYCTLCGSGIAYSARTAGGVSTFGTSGLLYRSNKLMYDRQTLTLWSQLTGEPVIGRLAENPVPLTMLPVALTTWDEWRQRHPETTVMKLDPALGARWRFDYSPGAADRARQGVSFPVWRKSATLPAREEVFALRAGRRAKAYPVAAVLREGLVNDAVGEDTVLLLGDRTSGAVRAYQRGRLTFSAGTTADELVDELGRLWRVEEDGLFPATGAPPALKPLLRLPGHTAFWFGWYAFFPETEVYAPRLNR